MTSSWLCSVSNSLISSWRTCGCSSWWHVQIYVVAGLIFKDKMQSLINVNGVVNDAPASRRTSSSKAKWIGVWSVCSWKYRGSDTVQSTHFKTPIATTGNLKKRLTVRRLYSDCSGPCMLPVAHRMHWYKVPSSATSSVAPLFSLQHRLCTVSMAFEVDFSSSLLMLTRLFWDWTERRMWLWSK